MPSVNLDEFTMKALEEEAKSRACAVEQIVYEAVWAHLSSCGCSDQVDEEN